MDWQELEQAVETLSRRIDVKPEAIVCIARGGMIPARLLCNHLGVTRLYCLSVAKAAASRRLLTGIKEDLSGQTVLLVEDALETGRNLAFCQNFLRSFGATVKTAALYYKPGSVIMPDYSLGERSKLPHFPWENR